MKPVNFFEEKEIKTKNTKLFSHNFFILILILGIIGGITFDYIYLNSKLESIENEYETTVNLEKDYEKLLFENEKLKKEKEELEQRNIVFKSFENKKDAENELIKLLYYLNELNSDNTYFTSISYTRKNNILIKGDSIGNSEIINLLNKVNEEFYNKFEIEEVNFANTYYKFIFKERGKENDI